MLFNMLKWLAIVYIIHYPASIAQNDEDDLYDKQPLLHTKSSTKTPYEYVTNNNVTNIPMGGKCKPVQLWIIVRHGTRYPNKAGIRALKDDIPVLVEKISKNRHIVR